jgi:MFS family permease
MAVAATEEQTPTQKPRPFRTVAANRDFRVVIGGLAVSKAGDWLYNVGLAVFIFQRTGSAGWVAAASVLRLLPYVLLAPFGGAIADRFDRKRVMIACDLVRAVLMGGLAATAALGGPVALAVAIAFLSTAAGTPYLPAVGAMTPQLVSERDLAAANAVIQTVDNVAIIAGPAIGGVLLALGPPSTGFAVNGGSFLAAALALTLLRTRTAPPRASDQAEVPDAPRSSVLHDVADGLSAMAKSRAVVVIVGFIAASAFIYGAETVLLVLLSEQQLGTGSEGYGYLLAALGLGGVLAAGLTGRLSAHPRTTTPLTIALLAMGLPLAGLAAVRQPAVAVVVLVVQGAGNIVVDVLSITVLQRTLPQAMLARILGVVDSLVVGAMLLGAVLAPALVAWLGLRGALVVAGLALPLLAVLARPMIRGAEQTAERRAAELAPRADALARLAIFESLPRPALEMLAASLTEQSVPAGAEVVREGEPADALYVVRSGHLQVIASGERRGMPELVNTLHEGDWFGEIGLLEGVARTATVRTTTDAVLWRIDGDDFLNAVNQMPVISGALLSGVVGRLARTHPSYRPRVASRPG